MATIGEVQQMLERFAPPAFQESYDNSGLLFGSPETEITGILVSLDCTLDVVDEAVMKGCNLIISHHPLVFKPFKKLSGSGWVEATLIKAIKNDIALYAMHTNLDNVYAGVNQAIAGRLGLTQTRVLAPLTGLLMKVVVFVPEAQLLEVQSAMFEAGAGVIGNYDHCGFEVNGKGRFRSNEAANPFVGIKGTDHLETEIRFETIVPSHRINAVLTAMKQVHPYEEVAYDVLKLENEHPLIGAGLVGNLPEPMKVSEFLSHLKGSMELKVIRHSEFDGDKIETVALCGGAGSFLLNRAKSSGAQAFVTSDFKYHEFFEGEKQILIADIGHFESEKYTTVLIRDLIVKNFPTFAVLLSFTNTNPVNYHI